MAEEKKMTLTIGERLAAIKIFDLFKGSLSTLSVLLEDVRQFTITPEEWEQAELKKIPSDDALAAMEPDERAGINQTWNWQEKTPKEIALQPESAAYLKEEIKKKSDAGEVTLQDVSLVTLEKKL